jgi:tRNA(Arg) A34 adenosine deaminase TadA
MHTIRPAAEFPEARTPPGAHEKFMRRAIALSRDAMDAGGGPFGAIIVLGDRIISEGINRVVPDADPTAHAEIVAIRDACRRLDTHILHNSAIYTNCEPCPMCLGAIWWARIGSVFYSNTRFDAESIGFDDARIYEEVSAHLTRRRLPMTRLLANEGRLIFDRWLAKPDRQKY